MSCDTAKENASVVDSSVTERKEGMGNSDEPGNWMTFFLYNIIFYLFFVVVIIWLVWYWLAVSKDSSFPTITNDF